MPIFLKKKPIEKARKVLSRLICMIFGVCVACFVSACANIEQPPKAVSGILDLTEWNFQKQGNVHLKGQWEFYWQQMLEPGDFSDEKTQDNTGMIDVPSFWNGLEVGGNRLKGDGYATLRLRVLLPPGSEDLAIRLEDQATAYRLWVNGTTMLGNGTVANNREESVPQYMVRHAGLNTASDSITLVLQISNYSLNLGGPYRAILLGNENQIYHYQNILWTLDLVPFGILISIGLYHISFFMLRRKDRSLLYFGIICLLLGTRILFWGTQGKYITILFPNFSWELANKFEFLGWYLVVPLLLMFFAELFPEEKSVKTLRFSQSVAAIAALIMLIFPARISNLTLIPYEIFAILNIIFSFQILIPAVIKRREHARLLLVGVLLFFLGVVNELLNEYYVVHTGHLIHLGMVAMILVHSLVLARRFSLAFDTIEFMSTKLKKKNAALSRSLDRVRKSYRALKDNIRLKAELKDQKQKEQEAYLKAEKEALEKLHYQLNPHFLFNALASIRGAVGLDADLARDMITRLSEFCRLTLDQGKKWSATIEESIAINRLYLDMEVMRLGSYLSVDISAATEVLHQKVPTNLLQPLVENAVKYGRLTSPHGLEIKVKFESRPNDRIRLEVSNTGTWLSPNQSNSPTMGIGLENVQNQLDRLYPNNHSFITQVKEGWVKVIIEIPNKIGQATMES